MRIGLVLCAATLSLSVRPILGALRQTSVLGSVAGNAPVLRVGTPLTIDSRSWVNHQKGATEAKNAFELFVNWLNFERGGLKVGNVNHTVELVLVNDDETPTGIVEAMNYLVDDLGIKLILGPMSSYLTEPAAGVVQAKGAVMVAPFAAASPVYAGRPSVFGTLTPADLHYGPIVDIAAEKGVKSISYLQADSVMPQVLCSGVAAGALSHNLNLIDTIVGPESWTNFTDAVAQLKKSKPEAVFLCMYSSAIVEAINEMHRQRFSPKLIAVQEMPNDFIDNFADKDVGRYIVGVELWRADAPLQSPWAPGWTASTFDARYYDRYGVHPGWFAASGWAAFETLAQAIEAADSVDPQNIVNQLNVIDVETLFGKVNFASTRQNTNPPMASQFNSESKSGASLVNKTSIIYPFPEFGNRLCMEKKPGQSRMGYNSTGHCVICPDIGVFKTTEQKRICQKCPPGLKVKALPIPPPPPQSGKTGPPPPGAICGSACPRGQGGLIHRGKPVCKNCIIGEFEIGGECNKCMPGSYSTTEGAIRCEICKPGTYQSEAGKDSCMKCSSGFVATTAGATACEACPMGTAAPEPAMDECQLCAVGTFSNATNSSDCTPCPGNGQATFTRVADVWVIRDGATSQDMCGCKAGLQPHGHNQCVECGEGLNCPGKDEVLVEPGYASDGHLSAYNCMQEPRERCPGGIRGVCADGRDVNTIACSKCEDGKTPGQNGTCKECETGSLVAPIIAFIVFFCTLTGFYIVNYRGSILAQGSSMVMIGILGAQVFGMVQSIGVLATINIEWKDPLVSLLSLFSLFNFDVDIIQPNCFMDTDPAMQFFARILIILVSLVFLVILHYVVCFVRHRSDIKGQRPVLVSSLGTVLYCFFLSVVSSVLTAFHCIAHPNDASTLWSYPSVLCWEGGKHDNLLVLSILSLSIPICFFSTAVWAACVFHSRVRKADVFFFKCWGFLFFRFTPQAFWYGLLVIMRNALLALSPLFYTTIVQVYFSLVVLIGNFAVACYVKPWTHKAANFGDIASLLAMLMFVASGLAFVENSDPEGISNFVMALLVITVTGALSMIVYALVHAYAAHGSKPFQYFLCHYKVEAGAFCRLLKTHLVITPGVKRKVFIDSDDLSDLPMLFGYVASETAIFVMVHSEGLLYRPWCMGEMVTAWKNKVDAIRVTFPDVYPPTKIFTEQYENYVPGVVTLFDYGITLDNVQAALNWFLTQEAIQLPKALTSHAVDSLSTQLVRYYQKEKIHGSMKFGHSPSMVCSDDAKTVMLVDLDDSEAVSTALIIRRCLIRLMREAHAAEIIRDADVPDKAENVLIVCTEKLFLHEHCMKSLLLCGERTLAATPILSDDRFRFPDKRILAEVNEMANSLDLDGNLVQSLISQSFNEIAIVFNPGHYSTTQAIMDIKITEIQARILKSRTPAEKLALRKMSTMSAATNGETSADNEPGVDSMVVGEMSAEFVDADSKLRDGADVDSEFIDVPRTPPPEFVI